MRIMALALGVALTLLASGKPARAQSEAFQARIAVDDTPLGGRLAIEAFLAAGIDERARAANPGRVLAVRFSEASEKRAFLIPADLWLETGNGERWNLGFYPLTEDRLEGILKPGETRWALWWVPTGSPNFPWSSQGDLVLHYGSQKAAFDVADSARMEQVLAALPWDRVPEGDFPTDRAVSDLIRQPNPAAFDVMPLVLKKKEPEYPKSAQYEKYEGTVHVAAVVDERGKVVDAFVVLSKTAHELNVAALAAVVQWEFRAGKWQGEYVKGEVVAPIRFSLRSVD